MRLACLTLIDYLSSVVVVYEKDGGFEEYELQVPLKGDNSNQTLVIDQENLKWIKVMFSRSGSVTNVKFCPLPPTPTAPAPTPGVGPPSGGEIVQSLRLDKRQSQHLEEVQSRRPE